MTPNLAGYIIAKYKGQFPNQLAEALAVLRRAAYAEGFRAGARAAYEKAAKYTDEIAGVVDSEDLAVES